MLVDETEARPSAARLLKLGEFENRLCCPSCKTASFRVVSRGQRWTQGEAFPAGLVKVGDDVLAKRELRECDRCGLWYYSLVPAPASLLAMLDRAAITERWNGDNAARPTFRRARVQIERSFPQPGAVLDIGAHCGEFLDTFPTGWRKVALEPMQQAARTIQNATVWNSFLEDADLGSSEFEVISAFDVFEHLPEPDLAMARIARALKPGGLFIMETGTSDAWTARRFRGAWYYVNYLEHFQVWNQLSLSQLFDQNGMNLVSAERVYHRIPNAVQRARAAVVAAVYAGLTGSGRYPGLWASLSKKTALRRSCGPPSTITLERDHLFVVAQKEHARWAD